ncbi:MAG TPA: hypothetical protein VGE38_05475 [Nocardioides sp.]|uniref:O-antigen ligase family protein n=1 Tax=Nocardioides sp. TaxID=35761 RepID=UPI002EDB6F37
MTTATVTTAGVVLPTDHPQGHQLWRALLVLTVLRGTLPVFIATVAHGSHIYDVQVLAQAGSVPLSSQLGFVLDGAIATLVLARCVVLQLHGWHRPQRSTVLIIVGALLALALNYSATHQLNRSVLVLCLAVLGLLLAPPPATLAVRTFWNWGLISVVASWAVAGLAPGLAWVSTGTQDRLALVSGERLTGVFSHPNELAYWTSALLAVGLSFRVPYRRLGLTVLGLTSFAAGSRTALLAAAILLLIWAVRGPFGSLARRGLAFGLLAIVALPVLMTPHFINSMGRQEIWNNARAHWTASPLRGHGLFYWQGIQARIDGFPNFAFHAHNQLLDTLMVSGALLAGVVFTYLAMHAWALLTWVRTSRRPLPGLAALVLVTAITEVPVQFVGIDPRTVILVIATITLAYRKA